MEAALQQAAKDFSDAIKADETVSTFFEARQAYDSNEEVYQMRLKYTQLVHDLRMKQNEGTLSEEDISELRQLEQQVNDHPRTQQLSQAQSSAIELLQTCNTRISERLGFDYGSSAAAPKGCGCS
ncbi:MAG: YlbF family regulator [Spirochaetales bacterium]